MSGRFQLGAIVVAAFVLIGAVGNSVLAQTAGEGITVNVVAEYPSRVAGIETVRLVRVVMKPGAAIKNVIIKSEEYCELKGGTLTHTNHTTGQVDVFTTGARWAPPKNDYHTIRNSGDDDVDMWVYQLVEEGQGGEDPM